VNRITAKRSLEAQYNLGDPFSEVWGNQNKGIVTFGPGQSTTWKVRPLLYTPTVRIAPNLEK
jgi:hypothetical protein